jgi:hypothetical protein
VAPAQATAVSTGTPNTITNASGGYGTNAYALKLLRFTAGPCAGQIIRIISNTSTVLTVYGTFDRSGSWFDSTRNNGFPGESGAPTTSSFFEIITLATTITNLLVINGQQSVITELINYSATTVNAINCNSSASIEIQGCTMSGQTTRAEYGVNAFVQACYFGTAAQVGFNAVNAYVRFWNNYITGRTNGVQSGFASYFNIRGCTITACTNGILIQAQSSANFDTGARISNINNCATYGVRAIQMSYVANGTTQTFASNGTNISADATTFAYIA